MAVAVSTAAPPPRPSAMSPRPVQAPRRAAPPARKSPGITINYAYLRRDLLTLGVLAPSMVVLVVVAYFIWH